MPYEFWTTREKVLFWIATIFFSQYGVATLPFMGLIIGILLKNITLVIVFPFFGSIIWLIGHLYIAQKTP